MRLVSGRWLVVGPRGEGVVLEDALRVSIAAEQHRVAQADSPALQRKKRGQAEGSQCVNLAPASHQSRMAQAGSAALQGERGQAEGGTGRQPS